MQKHVPRAWRSTHGRVAGRQHSLRRSVQRLRGAASADYVLGLGVVMPLLLIAIPASRRIMQLVYEFAATTIAWPFM
jgi:hypothetical protein